MWAARVSMLALLGAFACDVSQAQARDRGDKAYTIACSLAAHLDIPACGELPSGKACGNERQKKSLKSNDPATLTFVNRSKDTLKLYWLDFDGYRKLYNTLKPGDQLDQPTFYRHNWIVLASNGACLGVFSPPPKSIAFY